MTASKYCKSARRQLLALLLVTSPAAHAGEAAATWANDPQIHGFLSQGFVLTDHNSFFGDSESGSFEFTELGINASIRPQPSLLLTGQLLIRNAGDMYDAMSPQIDYALADWTFANNEHLVAAVTVGRQKNPIGLFNETRDVASTRPGVFVPQSVYFDKVRNLVLAADGIGLHSDWYTNAGNFRAEAAYGLTQVDTNVEYAYLGTDFPGELEADGPSWLGRLMYESHAGDWLLAASGVYSKMRYDADPGSPLQNGRTSFYYWVLSARYSGDNWALTGEYAWEPISWRDYGPALPDRDLTGVGWYIQGEYDLRDDLSLMLRYESTVADKDDADGAAASAATGGVLPPYAFYTDSWITGLRWDVTPQFMLRLEYQYNTGTHILSGRENPNPADLSKRWQLFSILGSYRF